MLEEIEVFCIPTIPGQNDLEIDADSLEAAVNMAESYEAQHDEVVIDTDKKPYSLGVCIAVSNEVHHGEG